MKAFRFLFLIFPLAIATPLAAETNSDCLASCTKDGKPASVCVPQCSIANYSSPNVRKQTDYRCLTLCVNDGKPAAQCMPQCTYTAPTHTSSTPQPDAYSPEKTINAHRLLESPHPAGGILVKPLQATTTAINASTDYNCIAQCMQQGMQYTICKNRCPGIGPRSVGSSQ